MGNTQSQKNVFESVADVANAVTQTTNVNEAQISSIVQSVNLDQCDIFLSEDFNVSMVSRNTAIAQQMASAKQDAELQNKIAQELTQTASGKMKDAFFPAGKQSSSNFGKQVVGLSNTISNALFESSTQYSSSVQSFNCSGSVIHARNLAINMDASNAFLADQTASNDQIATVANEVSQSADQTATNVNESSIGQLILFIIFLALGGGAFFLLAGGGVSMAVGGSSKGGIIILIIVVVFVAFAVAFCYAYQVPPLFNPDAQCSMSSMEGCPDVECVQPKGWRNWEWGFLPYDNEIEIDFAPMRYFYPLTMNDSPSPNADNAPSAVNANLLEMYIAKKTDLIGQLSNQGRTKELADRLADKTPYVAIRFNLGSDSIEDNFTIDDGTTSRSANYPMLPGQIVQTKHVSTTTLSRNAYTPGIGNINAATDTLFGPIYTPDGRVVSPSEPSVALWSIARIGQPIPAPMTIPGVCCGQQYAHAVKVPRPFVMDNSAAINGNQFNCCTPQVLSITNNGDYDEDLNVSVAAFDQCVSFGNDNALPVVADGYFNQQTAYDDLVCDDNTTSPSIGADAAKASSICGVSRTYSARAFCDFDTRSDAATNNAATQTGYVATVANHASGSVADSMIVAISNRQNISNWLNCIAPYDIVSQYNMQVDGGGSQSFARERRMRALYMRFVLLDQMALGVDLSIATDFRELVTFTDKNNKVVYTTYGDMYDGSSTNFTTACETNILGDGVLASADNGDLSHLRNCRCRNDTCNNSPAFQSSGCVGQTHGYCSSTPNTAGMQGPVCARYIYQNQCVADGNVSCQWNKGTVTSADNGECAHVYQFSGFPASMDTPEIDNFGRDGVELRKKSKGSLHGQFGVCNSPAYKLQQIFRHWLLLLLLCIGMAFLVYIVIMTVLRAISATAAAGGQLFSGPGQSLRELLNRQQSTSTNNPPTTSQTNPADSQSGD